MNFLKNMGEIEEKINEKFLERLLAGYDGSLDHSGISGRRMAERLAALGAIGLDAETQGVRRIGFSEEEARAKALVMQWMEAAGLSVKVDGAGNVFGRVRGKNSGLPAILSGSHVDSVPNGGHFDGPLGVLAALEVAEAWKETGYIPERPYEVVIFTDEEGARFNGGLNGSQAVTGEFDLDALIKQTDINGDSFEKVLDDYGLSLESYAAAKRDLEEIELFAEIHIEQGKRLELAGLSAGIVTGIAGPCWVQMRFSGEAGHAGNTPMDQRRDALVAASEFIANVPEIPVKVSSSAVATVGKIAVSPNGVNVIPGEVELYVDIRDIHESTRDKVVDLVIEAAENIARKHLIDLTHRETLRVPPVPIKDDIQEKLQASFEANQLEPFFLPSGAGHDAMIIGRHRPIAMIFVQSKDGVSHNPKEWSSLSDCVTSVHLLKSFIENY